MEKENPISESDYDELFKFLMSDKTPENCMDISMLDGFLTAIVSGPEVIMPSEWLPIVWGDKQGPCFDTIEEAKTVTDLIMGHMNMIANVLMETPEQFEPIIYERKSKSEETVIPIADEWCYGFMEGVGLREKEWDPILQEEKNIPMIFPIIAMIADKDDTRFKDLIDTQQKRQKYIDLLPTAVCSIHSFWLELRKNQKLGDAGSVISKKTQKKIGRNSPCPCGSGKKYKKCCGSPEKLH